MQKFGSGGGKRATKMSTSFETLDGKQIWTKSLILTERRSSTTMASHPQDNLTCRTMTWKKCWDWYYFWGTTVPWWRHWCDIPILTQGHRNSEKSNTTALQYACVIWLFDGVVRILAKQSVVGKWAHGHKPFEFIIQWATKLVCIVKAKKYDF